MKICFITNLYGDLARGGAERVVEAEAQALTKQGHEIVVISAGRQNKMSAESYKLQATSYKLLRFHPPNIYFYSDDFKHGLAARFLWHLIDIFNVRSAKRVKIILKIEKPDVAHTHNLMGLGFLIPGMLRRLKIKHVHTVHDVQLLHPSGLMSASGRRLAVGQKLYASLMRRVFGSPDTVIFPSKFLMEMHDRHGFFPASKKVILSNPAPDIISETRQTPPPIFLFAGQLEKHKGILFLLDVWESWKQIGDAELEIAGAGSLNDEVNGRARIAGVKILGRLDQQSLRQALLRSAYTVVPSLVIENAPSIIMESFSAGTPVIAAATGGIPELVSDGADGFLFAPGSANGLRTALDAAISSLGRWQELSAQASAKASHLSARRHGDGLLRLYQ